MENGNDLEHLIQSCERGVSLLPGFGGSRKSAVDMTTGAAADHRIFVLEKITTQKLT